MSKIWRVLVIENPCSIVARNRQLEIESRDARRVVPGEDVALLIIDSPGVMLSSGALELMANCGGGVVICDRRHLPVATGLPIAASNVATKVIAAQAGCTPERKAELRQAIIQAKLRGSSRTLVVAGAPAQCGDRILGMAAAVERGDKMNVEAQAARVYWPGLFGADFRRGNDDDVRNHALNYGYAIVRSAIAKGIVASGMHPSLGLFHHNQYDGYCLADDLMEPWRHGVDAMVFWRWSRLPWREVDREVRHYLMTITSSVWMVDRHAMPFIRAIDTYCSRIRDMICDSTKKIGGIDIDVELEGTK